MNYEKKLLSTIINKIGILARKYYVEKNYKVAIEIYELLSSIDSSYDDGFNAHAIGQCYEMLGDKLAAHKYFKIALNANPGIPEYQDAEQRLRSI